MKTVRNIFMAKKKEVVVEETQEAVDTGIAKLDPAQQARNEVLVEKINEIVEKLNA